MVRPTVTKDVLACNNRFAVLDGNYAEYQIRRTLQAETGTPPPTAGQDSTLYSAVAAGSADHQSRSHSPRITHSLAIQGKLKYIRDRSNSVKRKQTSQGNNTGKVPRVESGDCPHLKVIEQNKGTFSKILSDLSDYSGNDPLLCNSIRDLSIGMNGINDILGILLAERLIPGTSPEPIVIDDQPEETQGASATQFSFPPGNLSNNPRKPLNQQPLGNTSAWLTAVSKNKARHTTQGQTQVLQRKNQVSDIGTDKETSDLHGKPKPTKEELFHKSVKDAERSLLIFNLDLGQRPTMNPSTISGKVTLSLLNKMAAKEGSSSHSQEAKDFIDDILSQVVKMEFFGSKTIPCKSSNNSQDNAKFYTIPVKLMFKDRKAAQTAADLLRDYLGLNSTTPYHKNLRAAMNRTISSVKQSYPGYQVKTNLDLHGRSLKCFIRKDIKPPGNWAPHGDNIPLSYADMDTSNTFAKEPVRQIPTFSSPSPTRLSRKTHAVDNRTQQGSKDSSSPAAESSNMETDPSKTPEKVRDNTDELLLEKLNEVNKVSSPLPEFMLTPKANKAGEKRLSKKSGLVQHSPPAAGRHSLSSLGS
jgi:hypothetical protein